MDRVAQSQTEVPVVSGWLSLSQQIRINGIPLESWLLFPALVVWFYIVFRWRRYGEDTFAWNHEYFERACYVGSAVWVGTVLSSFLVQPLHVGILWIVLAVAGTFLLPWHWTETTLPRAAVLSFFAAAVGIMNMSVPARIHRFLFSFPPAPARTRSPLAGVPRSTFTLNLPPEWEEVPGQHPHLYRRRNSPKSGVFQTSFQPPPEHLPTDGASAKQQLSDLLIGLGENIKMGQRVLLQSEDAASGQLAFARYLSESHGLCQYWLLFSEPMVLATYTDSKDAEAEKEIDQLHETLKRARFIEGKFD